MKVKFFGHFKGIWGHLQFWMHHACKIGFYDPSNRDFMLHFVTFSHFFTRQAKAKCNMVWKTSTALLKEIRFIIQY